MEKMYREIEYKFRILESVMSYYVYDESNNIIGSYSKKFFKNKSEVEEYIKKTIHNSISSLISGIQESFGDIDE